MNMAQPEDWGAVVRAHKMPHEPEMIWYIEPDYARMTLSEQLELVLSAAKIMATVDWIQSGGILLIIWTTVELNGLEEALLDIARNCGIPITTLVN